MYNLDPSRIPEEKTFVRMLDALEKQITDGQRTTLHAKYDALNEIIKKRKADIKYSNWTNVYEAMLKGDRKQLEELARTNPLLKQYRQVLYGVVNIL